MKTWYAFEKGVKKVLYAGAWLGGLLTVGMFLLITVEVILRTFFSRSTLIADEMAGYLLAASVFLAAGYTMSEGAIVRIDLLYNKIPLKIRIFLDLFLDLIVLIYTVILFKYTVSLTNKSFVTKMKSTSILRTPMWFPQMFVPIGLVLLFLAMLMITIRDILKMTGKIANKEEMTATEKEMAAQMEAVKGDER